MKHNVLFAALAALLLAACGPDSTALLSAQMPGDDLGENQDELSSYATTWFPMDEGNEWRFRAGTEEHVVRSEYAYENIRYVSGLTTEPTWFGFSPSYKTNLYVWNEQAQGWSYHTRFGYQYTPWTVAFTDGPCDTFKAKRVQTGVTVTTPAGTFQDARVIGFDLVPNPVTLCKPSGISSITYAPGVGPVELVKVVGTQSVKFQLVSARVNGKTWSSAVVNPALKVTADQATYHNVPNSIRCITAPCPTNEQTAVATFTLTLKNTTSTSQTFEFGSSKQFDFELVDATGTVVRAWSDDRSFTYATTRFTLAAGATRTFTGQVELKDRDGVQLVGTFTVRGKLTTYSTALSNKTAETTITVTTP